MLRWLYIRLLWMHPAPFRWRFCDQMLDDFDRSAPHDRWRLVADGAVSVLRQWVLRPQFREEPAAAPAESAVMFHSLEDYKPSGSALMYGSMLSCGVFLLVVFALAHSNVGRTFTIGIQRPGLGLIPIDRDAFQASEEAVSVAPAVEPENPVDVLASLYFKTNPVARALDRDYDHTIASWELGGATAALWRLDLDNDRRLSAEECGFRGAGTRIGYMHIHPLIAALDNDHDGEISFQEVQRAAERLSRADTNRDGHISAVEAMPDTAASQAAFLRLELDTDGDGKISPNEIPDANEIRRMLWNADANHDGQITEPEIREELRRRPRR